MRILLFTLFVIASSLLKAQQIDYLVEGTKLYEAEKFKEAAELFEKGMGETPKSYELTKMYADALHKQELFEKAITNYDKAEKLNETDDKLYFNRGAAKVFIEEYKKAIKDFDKSIKLNPDFDEVYYFKGFCNYELSRYKESIQNYTKAIDINPDYAAAYYNRGAAKAELKSFEAGTRDFEIALEKNPDLENGRINIALSKLGQKKYLEAIKDFDVIIEERGKNLAKAYFYRGEAQYELDNKSKACDDWQKSSNLGNEFATSNVEDFCGSEVKKRREIEIVF